MAHVPGGDETRPRPYRENTTVGVGEVGYHDGSATLSIDWYPASGYAEWYANLP